MSGHGMACERADEASVRAGASGSPEDHCRAAEAHRGAASAAFAEGDAERGKLHARKARRHAAKAGKRTKKSPLARWAEAKGK